LLFYIRRKNKAESYIIWEYIGLLSEKPWHRYSDKTTGWTAWDPPHIVQTCSGTHPAGFSFLGVKWPVREADRSPPSIAKNSGDIFTLSMTWFTFHLTDLLSYIN
jgi:hypothetical protein